MKNLFLILMLTIILPGAPLLAESSQSNRKDKSVMVETHLGFNGIGAGIGIFLPNDSRLDISRSNSDIMLFSGNNRTYKLEYQSFVANSFYYTLGANYRTIKYSDYIYYSYDESRFTEIETVHAHFAIGNEWSFHYFFIGAEWFGFSTPLSWKYTNYYPDDAAETENQRWDKEVEHLARLTRVILPNLYIGFAF